MRIPLDYYRILGVPIQATAQQLSQSYHDRALQLPRREYSDLAINARKQLLDEAYGVLSDPEQRSAYDASFLAKTYELDQQPQLDSPLESLLELGGNSPTPWIEINHEQLVGALLIWQELGEYDLVLKLGQPLLENPVSISPEQERLMQSKLIRADVVLTIALACLELGREHWQQGHSEKAAIAGQTGQELLLREGLFPNVRGEIQADLYRLRPYRILELLSHEGEDETRRTQGIQLLRDMLHERGGIDGTGDDQSGLSVDDFLRFIQQIRHYLTVAEQQELFELEARRPSAVATYLAVYALIARGFAQCQPYLITRAKEMLQRLGRRQDVYLEQAVCALLLGQTEEASQALELSQEYEPLAFIRENSQDSPDLLPGLCLYGERWLQNEVFPHFRDLADQRASLKDYFADEQVQGYLEQLPSEGAAQNQWTVVESPAFGAATALQAEPRIPASVAPPMGSGTAGRFEDFDPGMPPSNSGRGAVAGMPRNRPPVERDSHTSPDERGGRERKADPVALRDEGYRPSRRRGNRTSPSRAGRRSSRSQSKGTRSLIFLGLGGVVGVFFFVFLIGQAIQLLRGGPDLEQAEVIDPMETMPNGEEMPVEEAPAPSVADPILTPEVAREVVQMWLDVKKLAFGSEYRIDQLETILTNPLLGVWRGRVQQARSSNISREYQHTVSVDEVIFDPAQPNVGAAVVSVRERTTEYRAGASAGVRDDNLRVRYELVRENNQWKIRDMRIL
ncbi:IMS domain-containing protein [Spirulina subsalsa FACHB-351]|uniref:IMS domain-containing protein n=1 Tax=Spirulina subsalsa FACHB-351 TaxID=234711 RepID=A0ABT3L1I5_9CYAN|nr:IMS domain-containing protein [Spirulina subsalsa]MCW6035361.1 IMS domain-containing protein [Spirulina subsalsa FACHB-351]